MFIRNINWKDFYRSTFEVCPADIAHKKLLDLNIDDLKQLQNYLEVSFNKIHKKIELQYSARYMVDKLIKNYES